MDPNEPTHDAAVERAAIRAMTESQLAELGLTQIAYVRPVMMDGALAYAIHAANGIPVGLAPDHDRAIEELEQHDLMQVLLH